AALARRTSAPVPPWRKVRKSKYRAKVVGSFLRPKFLLARELPLCSYPAHATRLPASRSACSCRSRHALRGLCTAPVVSSFHPPNHDSLDCWPLEGIENE